MPRYAIAAPDQQPDGGVYSTAAVFRTAGRKKTGAPVTAEAQKFIYRE